MPEHRSFAAVDLGASSGRVVVGRVGAGELSLGEVHRFGNEPVRLPSGLHWNVLGLYREVLRGLRRAAEARPVSVGVDSWAVDYGLLDGTGALLGDPHHYRDPRTDGVAEQVVREVGAAELYAANGLQFLPFNTIFQLAAARGTPRLAAARTLLLIPDLIGYWLTGSIGAEVTNASTTGLLDVARRSWSGELAAAAGCDPALLPALREPGERIGEPLPEVAAATGLEGTAVTAVASHDTASAVVGVPAAAADFGYVSCGTWSLAGLELAAPVRTEAARRANFTNELGVEGSTRFLRNIMGLWLVQETLRTWELDTAALPGLLARAAAAPPFAALVDPDDPRFLPPGDMPARIAAYCAETGQAPPPDRGALLRCVLESLALAHRRTIRGAARLADRDVRVVHLVGGGARNELLCQWTADALGLPVVAGPVEATAIGNVLVQARAAGAVGDLAEMRGLTAATQELRRYDPVGDERAWTAAASRIGLE
ncbi:rhamnulokinase [Spinactinospora alkalitolerans]|uniref:Rhamnulokinase n=1 Tax=Spinactinospora alkalitolerans TaxID=687207 RepID=A0A852TPB5_9ACTN|nr:rhamnulokinase family protein [Spinactinospora alkalitolerans]NYE46196.1 rhamnulokinase [Spinactinospora alkalitolerans]